MHNAQYFYHGRYLTHGTIDLQKVKDWELDRAPTTNDILIICGDFGGVWYGSKKDDVELNWWADRQFTTLFVDGNHENHDALLKYPVVNIYGGRAHQIRPNLFHLMRGEVYNIDGKKFFAMGGARSTDRQYRIPYVSWWPNEMPDSVEIDNAIENLNKNNWEVDYIITHCTDSRLLNKIDNSFEADGLTKFLDFVKYDKKLKYKKHYFGHYHIDINLTDKDTALYDNILEIKDE